MNKKKGRKKVDVLALGVFAGVLGELENIDLSAYNLTFFKADSAEFEQFLEKNSNKGDLNFNSEDISEFQSGQNWYGKSVYILTPLNFAKEVNPGIFQDIQNALLIIYPSAFRHIADIHYELRNNKFIHSYTTTYTFNYRYHDWSKNLLSFFPKDKKEILEFIKLYFKRKNNLDYLKITIDSYLDSFFHLNNQMRYIGLCICLESIVHGNAELNYRIARSVAIINGNNKKESKTIFNNVKEIYNLRSNIVHGSSYSETTLQKYLPRLRSLVSRTIVELLSFKPIKKEKPKESLRESLNKKLTYAGFGSKHLLTNKKWKVNILTKVEITIPVTK